MMYLIGGVAVLIFIGMAATGASGMTISSYPVPGGPQSKFADAIAHAEGFYVSGSRPARNNNPGDFKNWGGFPTDNDGYTIFPDDATGWTRLDRFLNEIKNGTSPEFNSGMTFQQMGFVYADGVHDPAGARNWTNDVVNFMGANVTDSIGDYL